MLKDLIEQARDGRAGFFLVFGGQGAGWFEELRGYYADASLRPLLDLCLQAMREELACVEGSVALPHGFEVDAWLTDPTTLPSPEYLAYVGVSVPLIFMTQLAAVRKLGEHGLHMTELLRHTRGASGQSQGLFAACLHALGGGATPYAEAVRQFAKFVFYLGVRSQEAYPFIQPTPDEVERAAAVSTWRNNQPTPMVAVVDAPRDDLERRVRQFNSKLPSDRHIHLSLRFSPTRVVLSGHRRSLIEFNAQHHSYLVENAIKYVYVRTTCPFHSRLMEPIRPLVEADFARIGFSVTGSDLQVPVYSGYDGRNLQDDEEASIGLYLDALIHPLDWRLALRPIAEDASITHVIDFGPGTESRHLSQHALTHLGVRKPIVSAATLWRKAA